MCAGYILTCAGNILTCAGNILTCAGNILTCAGNILTCAGNTLILQRIKIQRLTCFDHIKELVAGWCIWNVSSERTNSKSDPP